MFRFNRMRSTLLPMVVIGRAAMLSACGGGNNNVIIIHHTPTPTATPTPSPTPTPVNGLWVPNGAGANVVEFTSP
jgi:hypothetical protein